MKNKIAKICTGLALAVGLAVTATTPASAATYSFNTSCPSNTHVRIGVSAASYVHTAVSVATKGTRSGYGNWNWDLYGAKNVKVTFTTSYGRVNYICANGN